MDKYGCIKVCHVQEMQSDISTMKTDIASIYDIQRTSLDVIKEIKTYIKEIRHMKHLLIE